jgi:hypothetical protein
LSPEIWNNIESATTTIQAIEAVRRDFAQETDLIQIDVDKIEIGQNEFYGEEILEARGLGGKYMQGLYKTREVVFDYKPFINNIKNKMTETQIESYIFRSLARDGFPGGTLVNGEIHISLISFFENGEMTPTRMGDWIKKLETVLQDLVSFEEIVPENFYECLHVRPKILFGYSEKISDRNPGQWSETDFIEEYEQIRLLAIIIAENTRRS